DRRDPVVRDLVAQVALHAHARLAQRTGPAAGGGTAFAAEIVTPLLGPAPSQGDRALLEEEPAQLSALRRRAGRAGRRRGRHSGTGGGWGPGTMPARSGSSPGATSARAGLSRRRAARLASFSRCFSCRARSFWRLLAPGFCIADPPRRRARPAARVGEPSGP